MTSQELRTKYLDFFSTKGGSASGGKDKGHVVVPSSPLLPENDPTTLFTGSGMQPMIQYLLGAKHAAGTRIADSQKCFRAEDIEEVGDNRHTTFFEMLGNWSLGDYFKKEQISWMFEFLTQELGLKPDRIYVSVFRGSPEFGIAQDDEAVQLWQEAFSKVGIDAMAANFAEKNGIQDGERIFYYPDKKNWWSRAGVPANMPVGEPGGPDSEMFWDFGSHLNLHEQSQWKDEPCHVNCDCGRFMEIGNNVFMMFVRREKGFEELANKNIDFGGGLERMAAAVNDNPDMFLIDLFTPIREVIERLSGKRYGESSEETRSFRVIMDHLRAATFLIGDSAKPNNKDQGYFTRRLIRRSIRFAHRLGITGNFCGEIARAVIEEYKNAYPNLKTDEVMILQEMEREEEQFRKTLERGLKYAKEVGFFEMDQVDSRGKLIKIGDPRPEDFFELYTTYGFPKELAIEVLLETLETKKELLVESGFDSVAEYWAEKKEPLLRGFDDLMKKHQDLSRAGAEQKFKGGLADHSEQVTKLHTAHHLLLKALQIVLGPHVKQRGSNITGERLRIDFSHGEKMSPEQLKQVEEMVNQKISEDLPVLKSIIPKEEAEKLGAEHEFNAKYPDMVSVYSVGPAGATVENPQFEKAYSLEFCGGPHVERTGVIGKFKILKEEASSAGIRRIKAVAS